MDDCLYYASLPRIYPLPPRVHDVDPTIRRLCIGELGSLNRRHATMPTTHFAALNHVLVRGIPHALVIGTARRIKYKGRAMYVYAAASSRLRSSVSSLWPVFLACSRLPARPMGRSLLSHEPRHTDGLSFHPIRNKILAENAHGVSFSSISVERGNSLSPCASPISAVGLICIGSE
jgi:hypothetical protein